MPAEFDAKDHQHLRPFSFSKTSRDTGGSNPPRSRSQSLIPNLMAASDAAQACHC